MANKAIIPLYINIEILNNLFTSAIQEFSEIKSVSKKDIVTVHYKTPISEFSYDLFGKYVQGDLEIGFQNEFIKQKTDLSISQIVVVLNQLRDILETQGLLKQFNKLQDLSAVEENDYIEITTILQPNPKINRIKSIIEVYEIEKIFERGENKDIQLEDTMISFMTSIKDIFDKCIENKCQRFISYSTTHPNTAIITPLKKACMLDCEEYLLSGKVSIIGKVVKRHNYLGTFESVMNKDSFIKEIKKEFLSNTIMDKIDIDRLVNKLENRFPGIIGKIDMEEDNINNLDNIIEIIPISIVI
jgi:hypothetical protein